MTDAATRESSSSEANLLPLGAARRWSFISPLLTGNEKPDAVQTRGGGGVLGSAVVFASSSPVSREIERREKGVPFGMKFSLVSNTRERWKDGKMER
jgi:hypothetical protein